MRIGIIGATGKAGSALYREAARRGHEVTAIVRNPRKAVELFGEDTDVLERDAFGLTSDDLARFEVVVNAFATPPAQADQHLDLARQLIAGAGGPHGPRLVFILGAASLTTGADQHLYIEELRGVPGAESWIAVPEAGLKLLEYLRTVRDDARWVGVSPQVQFVPGPPTEPQIGKDEIMAAADGESRTTTGTMAVALLDEIEAPRHHNTRFTVCDA